MKRVTVLMPLISAIILTFASCSRGFVTNNGEAWATTYHIVYSSDIDLADSIEACMELIDRELSMFNPSSVLSAVNSGDIDTVDVHFRKVFGCPQYTTFRAVVKAGARLSRPQGRNITVALHFPKTR